jgi:hypothetical protein
MKIDSFFAELKRRHVVRLAGLYLVGAWLLTHCQYRAPDI